ncbi:MAG: hybrid sensor histidine kinase/response regulator [Rhodospirillales bacterium]|nr:hybrid sensor histidine kinase/response regulator [Rhodospirillales bacterium]
MDDLLQEFLAEASESLGLLDGELVRLEDTPDDSEILGNIFRVFHTIKGTCGFLNLPRLEKVAHAGEDLLSTFRDNAGLVTPEAVSLILRCVDAIRALIGALEVSGAEPEADHAALIADLKAAVAAGEARSRSGNTEPASEPDAGGAPAPADAQPEVGPSKVAAGAASTAPDPAKADREAAGEATPGHEGATSSMTIRVNVEVLESLITLVSELVLTRNQLLQLARNKDNGPAADGFQRLSRITTELQEGVMKTRMQPVGTAWAKLPRIVRDLSVETGKKIELKMNGGEAELDRQILEMIRDPLTHMVRNSADHGIEPREVRRAAGKPETGTITLNAFHEGGHIIIEIADDGRGLDIARIRDKIVERGLATAAELDRLTEQQIRDFIFRAGFSTAETVTSVSGRGVGMDVVRSNVEKIGGVIELTSEPGKGTTFTVKIPLTLAIVSALIVGCAGQRFAIPQICVRELVHVAGGGAHRVQMVNNAPVLSLRNRLLPLVSLRDLLKLEAAEAAGFAGGADKGGRDFYVVVAQIGSRLLGLIVDRVFDTEEIVVKPVGRMLRKIPFFSGTTILGDGSVIMILDPNGIAATAGPAQVNRSEQTPALAQGEDRRTSLIVFRAGDRSRKAVPMTLVERIENVDVSAVETVNGGEVVQYRSHMMPLVSVSPGFSRRGEGNQPVLVFADGKRTVGLMVDEIVDIVDAPLSVELKGGGCGTLGSAIIDGKATDLIDVGHYLTRGFADWFGGEAGGADDGADKSQEKTRLLLVDDSAFFLRLMSPRLTISGFEVIEALGGEEAMALHDRGIDVDVIVSDIEMPGMNGFAFAEAVHNGGRWSEVPMIALSSRLTDQNRERGRSAGFTSFVPKARGDELCGVLRQVLQQNGRAA